MIVYLLHYARPMARAGHYLGVATSEAEIRVDVARHGHGWRRLETAGAEISDVWQCETEAEALALRARFSRHGSRARLCSICSPGNARGLGTGNGRKWTKAAQ